MFHDDSFIYMCRDICSLIQKPSWTHIHTCGRELEILKHGLEQTDGPSFAPIGFQWSGEEEEEEAHLIDKPLMIKWGCVRACLLSCFCLQMAFNNLREIQLLLMLTACWLTYDTSQRFAMLEAANQAAWDRVTLHSFEPGRVCVCVCSVDWPLQLLLWDVSINMCLSVRVCVCVCVCVSKY